MVDVVYTVQNPHMTQNATQAVIKGVPMIATVDTFEVELVSNDPSHGGVKLRFIGAEIPAAQELFVVDSKVVGSFGAYIEAATAAA